MTTEHDPYNRTAEWAEHMAVRRSLHEIWPWLLGLSDKYGSDPVSVQIDTTTIWSAPTDVLGIAGDFNERRQEVAARARWLIHDTDDEPAKDVK